MNKRTYNTTTTRTFYTAQNKNSKGKWVPVKCDGYPLEVSSLEVMKCSIRQERSARFWFRKTPLKGKVRIMKVTVTEVSKTTVVKEEV